MQLWLSKEKAGSVHLIPVPETTGDICFGAGRVTICCSKLNILFSICVSLFSDTSNKQTATGTYLYLVLVSASLLVPLVPKVNAGKEGDNRATD